MFEYIKGAIAELTPTYVVVETTGIGYAVNISLQTYSRLHNAKEAQLWLHHIVREDAEQLFGFYDKDERELFRLLISVSGIGPNTGRMVLSSLTSAEVRNAILQSDINKIQSVKGIGLKTAQRIVVDLKDKVGKVVLSESPAGINQAGSVHEEALSALVMLGFGKPAVEKVLNALLRENNHYSIEELIKTALKKL